MTSELDVLIAKQAITEQIYRYCRAVDRMDPELGYSVWHEDATAEYDFAGYNGSGRGFIDWVIPEHRTFACHSHQVTNILIEIDGDQADSESCAIAMVRPLVEHGPMMDHLIFFRYLDRWEKRNGRWAIIQRRACIDCENSVLLTQPWMVASGRRDKSDLSYSLRIARVPS